MAVNIKLSKEAESKLRKTQRDLHDLLPFVDKLEKCGDHCDELRQTINDQSERVEALLKHFGNY